MTNHVYLLIYHRSPFHAHWSLFIPKHPNATVNETTNGTRPEALGDPLTGFNINIQDSEPPNSSSSDEEELNRRPSRILLGKVILHDNAVERVKDIAGGVEPPGRSLRNAASAERSGKAVRVEVRDCQTWAKDIVDALIGEGLVEAGAREVLAGAAAH